MQTHLFELEIGKIDTERAAWFRDEPSWPEMVEEVFVFEGIILFSLQTVTMRTTMTQRIIKIVWVIGLLCTFLSPTPVSALSVEFVPSTATVQVGNTLQLDVVVQGFVPGVTSVIGGVPSSFCFRMVATNNGTGPILGSGSSGNSGPCF